MPSGKIYLNGNSLGLFSREDEACLNRVIEEWKRSGIEAWTEIEASWIDYAERLGEELSPLIGAKPNEVVCTGTTTVNLHSLY